MPADYDTTARALSLSPRRSPSASPSPYSPHNAAAAPPWAHDSPSSSRLGQRSSRRNPYAAAPLAAAGSLWARAHAYLLVTYTAAYRRFIMLDPLRRVAVAVGGVLALGIGLFAVANMHRIIDTLVPVVKQWRDVRGGWVLVWFMVFVTSFPPVIGFSTASTVAGFVYGFPGAWPIVASACVAGSSLSFLTSRTVFSGYVHRLVGQDPRFVALGQVLRRDGLLMLTMIRFCPLPFSLSNGFLATIPTITPLAFAISTALSTPKLFIHIWLASRLAILAERGDSMSIGERLVNYLSMGLAGVIGVTVTIIIYKRTMQRAEEIVRDGDADDDRDVEHGLIENDQANVTNDEDAISLWAVDDEDDEDAYRDRAYDEIMGKPGSTP
ncbi:hypothetical protein TD95_005092 [Thielaviopsis punctulata]|uniref:Golgi apparatus membrane protein TVP38 n=1 Tax=Thielaviopsis punctulata TaxID=72032 RepID=A0A0F4ZJL4_9PEZI|nr:hypothetical protein TD95_005092 [Thielaviopsis punctulata]